MTPLCMYPLDAGTIIQDIHDSNDVELKSRPKLIPVRIPFLGVGTKLTIQRTGVIKQWRFYSPVAGWSVFQVWRPDPAVGQYRSVQLAEGIQYRSAQLAEGLQYRSVQLAQGLQYRSVHWSQGLQYRSVQWTEGLQYNSQLPPTRTLVS